MVRYWGVRIGRGGKYVGEALEGKFVTIGWNELEDLTTLVNRPDKLREEYAILYPDESELSQSIACGQIVRFVKEIQINDIVLVPDSAKGRVLIGRITGPNVFKENWDDKCPYLNRRSVEWVKFVERDGLPEKLKNSIGSLLTVFNIDSRADQVQELITGKIAEHREETVIGEKLAEVIVDRLFNLGPREFEQFVQHILDIIGFDAATMSYVSDGGVDVKGKLNAEGMAEVNLLVQVKRTSGKIGNEGVLKIRGALGEMTMVQLFHFQALQEKQSKKQSNLVKNPFCLLTEKNLLSYY